MEIIPSEPMFRFSLSNAHAAIGDYNRARAVLETVLEQDVDPDVWMAAKLRAAALRDPGEVAVWDGPVRDLQREALRGRIASGRATEDDVVRLARLAVEHRVEDPSGSGLEEAARAIENALERSPGHVSLTESLLLIHSLTGDARVDETLRELERVAADSPLLKAFVDDDALRRAKQQSQARLGRLVQEAARGDPAIREAALADLGAGVARFPGDAQHRTTYALALMIAGRRDEAVEQASVGARLAGENHAMHYNVGQVFLGAGEHERAREHLQLARRYARDDEERADADALLARLHG